MKMMMTMMMRKKILMKGGGMKGGRGDKRFDGTLAAVDDELHGLHVVSVGIVLGSAEDDDGTSSLVTVSSVEAL